MRRRGKGSWPLLLEPSDRAALVPVRPAEGNLIPPGPRDVGGPGDATPPRGLSPFGFARVGDLGPNENCRSPELGRAPFWERPSRALPDPEDMPRQVGPVSRRWPWQPNLSVPNRQPTPSPLLDS